MKISIDTNILIDDPKIVFDKTRKFVLSFTVIRELDKLKCNPDLKRPAQAAIRNIWHVFKENKIEILNVPNLLGSSPDEKIIQDTKNANASILSNDIAVRIIAHAHGVDISSFEAESKIDEDYTGYVEVKGDIEYEKHFIQVKELPLIEFNTTFKVDLKENMYCIINRIGLKNDIWTNRDGIVKRISQSMKPFSDAGIFLRPMDSVQMCALHAVFNSDVPLTVIDGQIGTGKTLLTMVGALGCTIGQTRYKKYDKIWITKPPVSTNRDLYTGYKPGPQPLSAKVLTPTGWTTMGEIVVGDFVMGRDGKPTKVLGVFPKGKKEVFKIRTTTGKSTLACGDHLWATQNANEFKHNCKPVVRTTKEIQDTLKYKSTSKFSHHLLRREPMEFDCEVMPLDPYVLGCLLGDGSLRFKGTPTISSVDIPIVQEINDRLKPISAGVLGCSGIDYTLGAIDGRSNKPKGINSQSRFTNPVKQVLASIGLIGKHFDEKFIPNMYMFKSSVDNRLDLLRGLMDTDGTVNRDGKAVFYTSGKPLKDSIIELVRTLGGSTNVYTRDRTTEEGHFINDRIISSTCECYEISILLPDGMVPYLLPRKVALFKERRKHRRMSKVTTDVISSITSNSYEEVQCILVDNEEHLYITDDYIVTHNTKEEKMAGHLGGIKSNMHFLLDKKDKEGKVDTTVTDEILENHFGVKEIDEIQGDSIHDDCLVVDEWELLDRDGAKVVISRIAEGSKCILVGDTIGQTYGTNRGNEGFKTLFAYLGTDKDFSYIKMDKIYRSRLAAFVAKVFDE